jgi:hypothetical protein
MSLTKDAKNRKGPQSHGIKSKVKFMKMMFHGQYLFLQVHDLSLKSKRFLQKLDSSYRALTGNKIQLCIIFKMFIILTECYSFQNGLENRENTAGGIRHADHVAPSIRTSWQSLRRLAAVARSI